jgi:hypothetical protein
MTNVEAQDSVDAMPLAVMEAPSVAEEKYTPAILDDSVEDGVEQAAINAELDALHAKLAKVLGLNERELELLGMEPPAKRKARFDERSARAKKTKPDAAENGNSAGAQRNRRTIKVGAPE